MYYDEYGRVEGGAYVRRTSGGLQVRQPMAAMPSGGNELADWFAGAAVAASRGAYAEVAPASVTRAPGECYLALFSSECAEAIRDRYGLWPEAASLLDNEADLLTAKELRDVGVEVTGSLVHVGVPMDRMTLTAELFVSALRAERLFGCSDGGFSRLRVGGKKSLVVPVVSQIPGPMGQEFPCFQPPVREEAMTPVERVRAVCRHVDEVLRMVEAQAPGYASAAALVRADISSAAMRGVIQAAPVSALAQLASSYATDERSDSHLASQLVQVSRRAEALVPRPVGLYLASMSRLVEAAGAEHEAAAAAVVCEAHSGGVSCWDVAMGNTVGHDVLEGSRGRRVADLLSSTSLKRVADSGVVHQQYVVWTAGGVHHVHVYDGPGSEVRGGKVFGLVDLLQWAQGAAAARAVACPGFGCDPEPDGKAMHRCDKCGFYVVSQAHEARCRVVLPLSAGERDAAWLGDALHSLDVRTALLAAGVPSAMCTLRLQTYASAAAQAEWYRQHVIDVVGVGDTRVSTAFEAQYPELRARYLVWLGAELHLPPEALGVAKVSVIEVNGVTAGGTVKELDGGTIDRGGVASVGFAPVDSGGGGTGSSSVVGGGVVWTPPTSVGQVDAVKVPWIMSPDLGENHGAQALLVCPRADCGKHFHLPRKLAEHALRMHGVEVMVDDFRLRDVGGMFVGGQRVASWGTRGIGTGTCSEASQYAVLHCSQCDVRSQFLPRKMREHLDACHGLHVDAVVRPVIDV